MTQDEFDTAIYQIIHDCIEPIDERERDVIGRVLAAASFAAKKTVCAFLMRSYGAFNKKKSPPQVPVQSQSSPTQVVEGTCREPKGRAHSLSEGNGDGAMTAPPFSPTREEKLRVLEELRQDRPGTRAAYTRITDLSPRAAGQARPSDGPRALR